MFTERFLKVREAFATFAAKTIIIIRAFNASVFPLIERHSYSVTAQHYVIPTIYLILQQIVKDATGDDYNLYDVLYSATAIRYTYSYGATGAPGTTKEYYGANA